MGASIPQYHCGYGRKICLYDCSLSFYVCYWFSCLVFWCHVIFVSEVVYLAPVVAASSKKKVISVVYLAPILLLAYKWIVSVVFEFTRTFTQVSMQWQDNDSLREELDDLQVCQSSFLRHGRVANNAYYFSMFLYDMYFSVGWLSISVLYMICIFLSSRFSWAQDGRFCWTCMSRCSA